MWLDRKHMWLDRKHTCGLTDDEKKKARWKEYFSELYNVHSPVDRSVLDELTATNTYYGR
jgi:hypothetical protein